MLRRITALLLASVMALVVGGCGTSSSEQIVEPPDDQHDGHDHTAGVDGAHPEQGPHGGHLIELGDEQYHAELVHDEATHTVTIHLLDSAGTQPIETGQAEIRLQVFRDGQFVDYRLPAAGGSGESVGSHFQLIDEGLTDFLLHTEVVRGRLHVTINEQEYIGAIDHTAHDHDAHEGHEQSDDHSEEGHLDH